MKSLIFPIFLMVLISACTQQPEANVCPEDAKLCPDGTSVGRVPPTCEFAACPVIETNETNETTEPPRLQGSTTFSGGISITLTSPVGGENWIKGSMQTISWNSVGIAHYQLWYTTDSSLQCEGGSWTLLQSHPYQPTSFNWDLPSISSNTFRVRIEGHDSGHGTLGYTCSGEFSIT